MNTKYYMDKIKRTLVKAYMDGNTYTLEMISLIPKYRRGYHRNVFKKQFDNKDHANNYFLKLKKEHELEQTTLPGMANGHIEY